MKFNENTIRTSIIHLKKDYKYIFEAKRYFRDIVNHNNYSIFIVF